MPKPQFLLSSHINTVIETGYVRCEMGGACIVHGRHEINICILYIWNVSLGRMRRICLLIYSWFI